MREAVIVAYGRTPVCKARKGSFAGVNPLEWGAQALLGTLKKVPQLDVKEIDDLVVGTATPANELGGNVARLLINRAGLPESIPGQTINRFCSSSLQAIATCACAILAGQAQVMVAGGIEYMSSEGPPQSMEYANPWLMEHYPGAYMPMGLTAENVVKRYGITREEMDRMAVESNRKAWIAQQEGGLNKAIIPITISTPEGERVVSLDEGIRPDTSLEICAGLKTAFIPPEQGGTVTAATSSQTSDGASFVVLMSGEKAAALGVTPIARFLSFAAAGCPAEIMGVGPIYAVPKALELAGLTLDKMDVIELNEAFASQTLVCIRTLDMPKEKVNPWGGAMALGHPMGATGGFLLSKALDYLRLNGGRYALVTMCVGGGMGAAGIFELLDVPQQGGKSQ